MGHIGLMLEMVIDFYKKKNCCEFLCVYKHYDDEACPFLGKIALRYMHFVTSSPESQPHDRSKFDLVVWWATPTLGVLKENRRQGQFDFFRRGC